MTIINKLEAPDILLVGAPTLINPGNIGGISKYSKALGKLSVAFASLPIPAKGKVKKADYLEEEKEILSFVETVGIKIIAVAQADYFKFMTGEKKFDVNFGDVFKGTGLLSDITIVPILNVKILSMYPNKKSQFFLGVSAVERATGGDVSREKFKLKSSVKVKTFGEAYEELKKLSKCDKLTCDIETTGLKFETDKLLTISFSPDIDHSVCIGIHENYVGASEYPKMIKLMKKFFESYKGELIFHNAGFDASFIVHEIMVGRDFSKDKNKVINNLNLGDTLLMAYILKNSTERAPLGLKDLSYAEYGEYDKDVDQSKLIEYTFDEVAEYNNYDTSATWFVYNLFKDDIKEFGDLYTRYLGYMKMICKVRMNGLVVDKDEIDRSILELEKLIEEDTEYLYNTEEVLETEAKLNTLARKKYNSTHVKQKMTNEFNVKFNPNSSPQKRILLYDVMGLSTEVMTKTGEPSTGKEAIDEVLMACTPEQAELINKLQDISTAKKVTSTYLETFRDTSVEVKEGEWRIFGNFNLTGTISGRLSSNNPNLQNIPSGSKYGELVKKCFISPENKLFAGSDYSSLEDRLIAIESGSRNKLRVFTDGIDGHSLNTLYYFREELKSRGLDIDEESVESINSIKHLAEDLRYKSKPITFAMAYDGTEYTVSRLLKITTEEAEEIVANYKILNKEVIEYKLDKVGEALDTGCVISKFSGLRLLTPNINSMDKKTQGKEQRVIGNFSIQSGSILMLDAMVTFEDWLESENLTDKVEVISNIHDAIYLYIENDSELISRVNTELIKIMTKDYKENQPIHLEAELDIGNNWANEVTLPNNATALEVEEYLSKLVA